MIPKKLRTPSSVFSKKPARRLFSEYFQVKIYPTALGYGRFGAVVGTKVDKSSVRRHFWKRFILDSAAGQKNLSGDLVIIAKPELGSAAKEKAKKDLSEILEKLK